MEEKISSKRVFVTPAMAQQWLNEKNVHNRPLYQGTVDAYALDMKRKLWAFNHQGICFDEDGNLLDGQHRLAAIILSRETIPLLVVRGMPKTFGDNGENKATQETIDGGKTRSVGDRLTLCGIENAVLKTAIINSLINICTGRTIKTSPGIILEVLKIYGFEINIILENRSQAERGLIYSPTLASFVFSAKCFKEKTVEFERSYFSGLNLKETSPARVLRRFMMNHSGSGGAGSSYRREVQNKALTCLMYQVQDLPLKTLVSNTKGLEFFENKQKRVVTEMKELFRL